MRRNRCFVKRPTAARRQFTACFAHCGRLLASARTSAAGYRVVSANTPAVLVENDDSGFDIRIVRVVVR